ncbi:MAG: TonB family protein [Methanococcaceae archaeon]
MKTLFILIFLSCTIALNGQKVYIDEYKASVADPSAAKQFVIISNGDSPDGIKETYYYISGEKKSESSYIKSSGKEGVYFVWDINDQYGKYLRDGKSITWYINGQIKSENYFIRGKNTGKYLTWFENGQLESESYFVDNKIEGKLIKWFENGQLKSEIDYQKSKVQGELKTYWKNGSIKRKEIYDENKLTKGSCYDSLGNEVPHFELEQMPKYKGGDKKLLQDITNNAIYPKVSRDLGIKGKVIVRFKINKLGNISDIDVIQGVNGELNKEAVRVVGTLKKFTPAFYDGEPFDFYYMVPINFGDPASH